jgi:hypothetical protein
MPEPCDELEHEGLRFRVEDVEGSRIEKLTVTFEARRERRERERELEELGGPALDES